MTPQKHESRKPGQNEWHLLVNRELSNEPVHKIRQARPNPSIRSSDVKW